MAVFFAGKLPSLVKAGAAKSTSNTNSYSFAGVGIGAASTRKQLVIAVASFGGAVTLDALRVGGLSASIIGDSRLGTGYVALASIDAAALAGTTATIEADFTAAVGTAQACLVEVYALYDARNAGAVGAIVTDAANPAVSLGVDVPSRGFAIAAVEATTDPSWTVATPDHADVADGLYLEVAHYAGGPAGASPAAITANGAGNTAGIAAAFR